MSIYTLLKGVAGNHQLDRRLLIGPFYLEIATYCHINVSIMDGTGGMHYMACSGRGCSPVRSEFSQCVFLSDAGLRSKQNLPRFFNPQTTPTHKPLRTHSTVAELKRGKDDGSNEQSQLTKLMRLKQADWGWIRWDLMDFCSTFCSTKKAFPMALGLLFWKRRLSSKRSAFWWET